DERHRDQVHEKQDGHAGAGDHACPLARAAGSFVRSLRCSQRPDAIIIRRVRLCCILPVLHKANPDMIPTPPASPAASRATGTDLERLQGVWKAIAGRRAARFLITETRFTFEFVGGEVYEGTIRLDTNACPARMDMRIDEGPGAHRGQVSMCIYHVD